MKMTIFLIALTLASSSFAGIISRDRDSIGTPCENYDLSKIEEQIARQAGKGGSWASSSDYPSRALQQSRQGVVTFKVLVGTDGYPQRCWVVQTSGHNDLDAAACSGIMKRARFDYARDDNQQPIEGCYGNRMEYKISP